MLRRLQQPESCLSAFCWIVLVGWLDSGAVNASRCAGHHQLPTSHPLVVPCTFVQCVASVEGARSVHEVVDNPDFLIKSHSVDHKSGHLPSLYPSPLLFIQCHKIALNVYALVQTWIYLGPGWTYSAPHPILQLRSPACVSPLTRWAAQAWAAGPWLAKTPPVPLFSLVEKPTHLWPRQKHAPDLILDHNRTLVSKLKYKLREASWPCFDCFKFSGVNHNLPLNFWDDETLQKIKRLSLITIYLKWHLMS